MAQAVIMAGGQGERFWPMTDKRFPKYRISVDGKRSLLQGTRQRLARIFGKNIHVVTTGEQVNLIRKELPGLPLKNIIVEPARNNTAPAIYLSTALLGQRFGADEVTLFFPADHLIQNETLFKKTVRGMIALAAAKNCLVTAGIRPTFPATGYGYIQAGSPIKNYPSAFRVRRFVEK